MSVKRKVQERGLVFFSSGLVLALLLSGCSVQVSNPIASRAPSQLAPAPSAAPAPLPVIPIEPVPIPVPAGATVTALKVESTASSEQSNVPITFGQIFKMGELFPSEQLVGRLDGGALIALQVEPKATHSDGSVRHAVISAVVPSLAAGASETLSLVKASGSGSDVSYPPNELLNAGFTADVTVVLGGQAYTASADALLRAGGYKTWLSGPIANEWLLMSPLKTAAGVAHPHLTARFAVRSYTGLGKAKVDIVLENNWAYEANPQNFTYDVQVQVGGQPVYSKTALVHYRHARWKKSFHFGAEPQVHLRHDKNYLIASRAIPNYDPSIVVPESELAAMQSSFTGPKTEPMGEGFMQKYMPSTGGRPDIGLMPGWNVKYLLSQDRRAKETAFATAELGGSFSSHYRDRNTDLPLSLADYPYATLVGTAGDSYNPATKKQEKLPACSTDCTTPNFADVAHQPALNYLPYLVTGDHYQLEELHFWAAYNVFNSNPHYREFGKGLVKPEQLRGQGWALRTLGEAAYITPDAHPLKSYFEGIVNNNLDWYNANYTDNPGANALGVIVNGYSISYNNSRGIAPWMDDFFTQSIGHLVDLGFAKAKPLLAWKAKFPIARMTDPGYCWIVGATYALNIRDTSTSPFYTTMAEAYAGTFAANFTSLPCAGPEMAAHLSLKVGEMTGYSDSASGFPSNMQPALAYAATSGAYNGAAAWQVFLSRTVKPDYRSQPQFAIVPRE